MENIHENASVQVTLSRENAKYSHTSKQVIDGEDIEVEVYTM